MNGSLLCCAACAAKERLEPCASWLRGGMRLLFRRIPTGMCPDDVMCVCVCVYACVCFVYESHRNGFF